MAPTNGDGLINIGARYPFWQETMSLSALFGRSNVSSKCKEGDIYFRDFSCYMVDNGSWRQSILDGKCLLTYRKKELHNRSMYDLIPRGSRQHRAQDLGKLF
jgi:hypothetical protein